MSAFPHAHCPALAPPPPHPPAPLWSTTSPPNTRPRGTYVTPLLTPPPTPLDPGHGPGPGHPVRQVVTLEGDLSYPGLGLSEGALAELAAEPAVVVIHSAARC